MEAAWPLLLPLILGFLAVYWLLPSPRPQPALWGGVAAGLALLATGFFLIRFGGLNAETLLFYAFSAVAIVGGGMLITQKNPVHAALSFALVVLSTCGLFLLQAAPFLMAATIIVYAGAIVVTFLFVIMLAQQAGSSDADQRSREPFLATVAGFVLLGAILSLLRSTYDVSRLENLLRQAEVAETRLGELQANQKQEQLSQEEVRTVIEVNLDEILKESSRVAGLREHGRFSVALYHANFEWNQRVNLGALKKALGELRAAGMEIRDSYAALQPRGPNRVSSFSGTPADRALADVPKDALGRVVMPAENVAFLGRALFTDYLLAVELGGMLLLVATIGAIAMVSRRPEGLPMTPIVGLYNYLVVGAILFALGAIGFLTRRNLIIMFLSAEMMLQGVALNLVAFGRFRGNLQGQVFVLFLLTVAACEAGIALALILTLYRRRHSLDVSLWQDLREAGQEATVDEEPLPAPAPEPALPRLTPTGLEPPQPQEPSHV